MNKEFCIHVENSVRYDARCKYIHVPEHKESEDSEGKVRGGMRGCVNYNQKHKRVRQVRNGEHSRSFSVCFVEQHHWQGLKLEE